MSENGCNTCGDTPATMGQSNSGCPEYNCDCQPLTGGVRVASSGTSVNQDFVVGVGATVNVLDAPSWATASVVNDTISITGVAPIGSHTLVYDVINECSKECLVIKIAVAEAACPPPVNIVKNIGYVSGDGNVDQTISLPSGGTIVSEDLDLNVAVYSGEITISGRLKEPYPTSYLINMTTPCGAYTVSGNYIECVPIKLSSISGSSVFEKGLPASMSWVVEGTGNVSVQSFDGIPAGMTPSVQQNTPSPGFATITIAGSPTDNTGAGAIKLSLKGQCGVLSVERAFTQQPCRALQITGESGSSQMIVGTPVNYCKIVKGYEPTIEKFENLPLGLSASIAPTTNLNEWSVCLSGTPILDPCKDSEEGKICDCGTVSIKNECGSLDVEFCFNLDVTGLMRPKYCVGVVILTPSATNPVTYTIEVIGVTPNTTASIDQSVGTSSPVQSISIDNTGYGIVTGVTFSITAPPYPSDPCKEIKLKHPTCALIVKDSAVIAKQCYVLPPDNGGN